MNEHLNNLMLNQSLLAKQIEAAAQEEREIEYAKQPKNTYNQLKLHEDTVISIPFDSSSGMNYPLYEYLTNTTLDLSYTREFYYEPDYRNGLIFRYVRHAVESTGSASTQPPNITTINIK
jgi:hypothetical protein